MVMVLGLTTKPDSGAPYCELDVAIDDDDEVLEF
jgi:hypothetical protein